MVKEKYDELVKHQTKKISQNNLRDLRSGRDLYQFRNRPVHRLYAALAFDRSLNRSLTIYQ